MLIEAINVKQILKILWLLAGDQQYQSRIIELLIVIVIDTRDHILSVFVTPHNSTTHNNSVIVLHAILYAGIEASNNVSS